MTPRESQSFAERRSTVEWLVQGLPGNPGSPEGEAAFQQPWELRAFALAVAVHEAGKYRWPQFQAALIDSINAWETQHPDHASWSYYRCWVEALERVLGETGLLPEPTAVDKRTEHVLATVPDRSHQELHLDPVAIDRPREGSPRVD